MKATTRFSKALMLATLISFGQVQLQAQAGVSLTTLHSFSGMDGSNPDYGALAGGPDNSFYGITRGGGPFGEYAPTIFKITRDGMLTTLYWFSGPDGWGPWSGLVLGSDGNFYGTTQEGGATWDLSATPPNRGKGTAFK